MLRKQILYIYNSINIDTTLITLNSFFENNINLQTENIKKIIWIDEDKLKENVFSIVEAKQIILNNIDVEKKTFDVILNSDSDLSSTEYIKKLQKAMTFRNYAVMQYKNTRPDDIKKTINIDL